MDRRAAGARGDAGLAQHGDGPTFSQRVFKCTQLGIDVSERRQLGEDQSVVALSEPVQVEDQAAEVAVAELACLAQEARAAPYAAAGAEADGLGCRSGAGGLLVLLRLLCIICGGSASYLIHGRSMLPRPSVHATRKLGRTLQRLVPRSGDAGGHLRRREALRARTALDAGIGLV